MTSFTPLKKRFQAQGDLVKTLMVELNRKNVNAVPRVTAVHINVGVGKMVADGKEYDDIVKNIEAITGQKPFITKSKKAISNFKLKEGMVSGIAATLRGKHMYGFLDKLVNVVFPRIRDFRGISPASFDGHGNYSVAIREHTVFPEIHADDVSKVHGVQITIKTTANTDEEGRALLKAMGFPFTKPGKRGRLQ